MKLQTSFDFDPRTICLATEAPLLTLTLTRSAKRRFESLNNILALLLDADAISVVFICNTCLYTSVTDTTVSADCYRLFWYIFTILMYSSIVN